MAKPTISNKKTVSKKQNKSFLGKKFDLKSRKVQFFVSILIIAILGGGYFTFRSFAATGIIVFDAAGTRSMEFSDFNKPGCSSKLVYPPSKNNAPAPATSLNIYCIGPSKGSLSFSTAAAYGPNGQYNIGAGTHRVCMVAKANGDPAVKLSILSGTAFDRQPNLNFSGSEFRTLCSAPEKLPKGLQSATGIINFPRGGSLDIAKITLEVVSYDPIAPTTTKN